MPEQLRVSKSLHQSLIALEMEMATLAGRLDLFDELLP